LATNYGRRMNGVTTPLLSPR